MIVDEPSRGGIPAPWFSALPGIDRVQAFSQGLILLPPLARLQGMRAAHVGPGSGTWTVPASAWTRGLVGIPDICAFVETTLTGVTMTAASAGHEVVPRTLVINYFRPHRSHRNTISIVSKGNPTGYPAPDAAELPGACQTADLLYVLPAATAYGGPEQWWPREAS
jgi:hypothetical protein